ncbi:MAG TPA: FHA domain-containing protein [Kofleriaceae bacterium]
MVTLGVMAVWTGSAPVSQRFAVPAEGLVLGRDLIAGTTDDRISSVHARLEPREGRLELSDAGSRNGTYLNGHQLVDPSVLAPPRSIIRTGRTLWAVVTDDTTFGVERTVRTVYEAIRAVAPELGIHVTVFEHALLTPVSESAIIRIVTAAARAREAGPLRGDDCVFESPRPAAWAVFPGASLAKGMARRFEATLRARGFEATASDAGGANWLVEVSREGRRIAITCPPSTAFKLELADGETAVAEGFTIDDDLVIACAIAWLGGAAVGELDPTIEWSTRG